MKYLKFKTAVMAVLIKCILRYPNIMQSKLFMKAMIYFPEKISSKYDKLIEDVGNDYQDPFLRGLDYIDKEPQRILDLCTGTGFAAFLVAKRFPEASIEAVDQSIGMIRISKEKAEEQGIDSIHFRRVNAINLEYSDNEFDLIVSSNAPIYLSEAARVLKPGGSILVSYSFGGKAFVKERKQISFLLESNGLNLGKLVCVNKGVYIIGGKY